MIFRWLNIMDEKTQNDIEAKDAFWHLHYLHSHQVV